MKHQEQAVLPSAPTIADHLDRLRNRVEQSLTVARRRDRGLEDHLKSILTTIDEIKGAAPVQLLAEETVRYPEDCQRIQTLFQVYRGEHRSLRECEDAWLAYSQSMAAGWMTLPTDDEDLLSIIARGPVDDCDPELGSP
jgi:hypothetical protein